jgi:hypothetical protein
MTGKRWLLVAVAVVVIYLLYRSSVSASQAAQASTVAEGAAAGQAIIAVTAAANKAADDAAVMDKVTAKVGATVVMAANGGDVLSQAKVWKAMQKIDSAQAAAYLGGLPNNAAVKAAGFWM